MTKGKLFPQTILRAAACLVAPLHQEKQMKLKLQFIIAAFIGLVIYIPVAHGQARLTFSGGSGTPLSTTLQTAVTYTINNTLCAGINAPFFVFQGVGNPLTNTFPPVTSTMTFSITGATSQPITDENSGVTNGNFTANDLYVFGATPGVAGAVILSADNHHYRQHRCCKASQRQLHYFHLQRQG